MTYEATISSHDLPNLRWGEVTMCPRMGVARESSTHSFCVGVPHALVEGDYLVTNRSRLRVHDSMRLDHLGDARVTLKVGVIRHSFVEDYCSE